MIKHMDLYTRVLKWMCLVILVFILLVSFTTAAAADDDCPGWLSFCGALSAYAKNVTNAQLAYHGLTGEEADVYVAVPNCGAVGWRGVMTVGAAQYSVAVFDCAGPYGHWWMTVNGVAAEVDYYFWMEHPELVGSGLPVHIQVQPVE